MPKSSAPSNSALQIATMPATMPALPDVVALKQQIDHLQSDTQQALEYVYQQLAAVQVSPEPATPEQAETINNALLYINQNTEGLQLMAQQAHSTLAAIAAYAQNVTEQRDMVVAAYTRAFEHGVLHAYECEACMEDAAAESMAERMLETSVDEVGMEETAALNDRLMDAVLIYEEWAQDIEQGEHIVAASDRTALLNLVNEVAGGIDLDNVEYDSAQSNADQALILSLGGGDGSDYSDEDGE